MTEWDATAYNRLNNPMQTWGEAVVGVDYVQASLDEIDFVGIAELVSLEVAAQCLSTAGFVDVETGMFEAPVQLESRQATYEYFDNVILVSHLGRIADPALRASFVESMTEQSAADDPPFRQDYWRLNLRARRPES